MIPLPAGVSRWQFQRNQYLSGSAYYLIVLHICDAINHVLQVTDWLAHVPKEVIAKNFQLDITAFDHIPSKALFIFPSSAYSIEYLVNPSL